jgi:hypothetical protein
MRTRLLRPGFFENETLAQLPVRARLLFAGLWLLADRAGRLEDRPARIRAALFAYETVELDPLLDELAAAGFISRYVGPDGRRCLHITKFLTHQNPHHREPDSTLPSPPYQQETLSKNTKPRQSRGQVEAAPQTGLSDTDTVRDAEIDPVRDPVEDQDQPAAPVCSNAEEVDPDPNPAFKRYAAIASAVLQELAYDRKHDDLGTATEAFKRRCAKQGLPYDGDVARKAIDAAQHARDKKAAALRALLEGRRHAARA